MRSSSSAKQVGRICDACKNQQRRNLSALTTHIGVGQRAGEVIASQSIRNASRMLSTKSKEITQRPLARAYPSETRKSSSATRRDNVAAAQQSNVAGIPQTHYDFFPKTLPQGAPPKGPFAIDVRALRREFLVLQGGAHPDRHPQHLKWQAEATSSRINEAFRTLESPLQRAQYLLHLRGFDVANDETAKVEDPELLMLVLETREAIEEAQEESDLEGMKEENESRMRDSEEKLTHAFSEDNIEAAKKEVVRLRYWTNIRDSIKDWEKGKPVLLQH